SPSATSARSRGWRRSRSPSARTSATRRRFPKRSRASSRRRRRPSSRRGAGINQWTAAEGALKVRETSRVFTSAYSVEQSLHGPAVALEDLDALVALDGGGPFSPRLADVAGAAAKCGVRVHTIREQSLGEPLSIFPLTAAVQRIALESALAAGSDPDAFGFDVPGRQEAWEPIEL